MKSASETGRLKRKLLSFLKEGHFFDVFLYAL